MRKLLSFITLSLDGYFAGPGGDMRWAHAGAPDPEWDAFVAGNASGGGALLFGRITYDMMASYWPTPMASTNSPTVAQGMNAMPKFVASRTLDTASWQNTTVLKGDLITMIRQLKEQPGPGIAILGSGNLVSQLAAAHLIDKYQIVIRPIAFGEGRSFFAGLPKPLNLELTNTRVFKNGNVFNCYEPRP